jgi:hypothetical protein
MFGGDGEMTAVDLPWPMGQGNRVMGINRGGPRPGC